MRKPRPLPDFTKWRCLRCGCTERHACPPTCWWVGKELCSSCATPVQLYMHEIAELTNQLPELFAGTFKLPKGKRLKDKGREDGKGQTKKWRLTDGGRHAHKPKKKKGGRPKVDPLKFLPSLSKVHGLSKKQLSAKWGFPLPKTIRILDALLAANQVTAAPASHQLGRSGIPPMLYKKRGK